MFITKKITAIIALLMILVIGLSVLGSINVNAFWGGDGIDVDGNGIVNGHTNSTQETFGKIMDKYKGVITFVSGIATVTMVAIFILNFMKLGSTSTNPTERQKVLTGLIWSGIAAALLGSVTLIVGVFYGMLK